MPVLNLSGNPVIRPSGLEELTAAVEQEANKRPEVLRLMTHPGVGGLTALAYVLIIGTPERFRCGKQIGSYVGIIFRVADDPSRIAEPAAH